MNRTLLKRVCDAIVAHPQSFSMAWFFSCSNNCTLEKTTSQILEDLYKPRVRGCGTTACIAGWALALEGADLKAGNYAREAAFLLDITPEQGEALFDAGNWPLIHRRGYYDTGSIVHLSQAVRAADVTRRRINYFLRTGT